MTTKMTEAGGVTESRHLERTNVLAGALKTAMDEESGLFYRLGGDVERLREAMQAKSWKTGLAISQAIERSAAILEKADGEREAAFVLLRGHLDLPRVTSFSAVLPALPEGARQELELSWRGLRASIVRLKTASSRMKYSAEAIADALGRIVDQVFPSRRGKIYSRRGTPTSISGALLVDHKL